MRSAMPYCIAMGSVVAATLIRWLLDPYLVNGQVFSAYYAAVAITAWLGGWRPALVALVLGGIAADWFFSQPRGSMILLTEGPHDWVPLAMYVCVSLAITACVVTIRRKKQPPLELAVQGDPRELLAVARSVRQHGINSRELPAYLEGLNASNEMFVIASTYDVFDLDPDELAAQLDSLAQRAERAAAAPASH